MTSLPKRALSWLARRLDARRQQQMRRGGPVLNVLLFHGLYPEQDGSCPASLDAGLASRVSFMEQCLQGTLDAGFRFIHPDELGSAGHKRERMALLTFDDGYANNLLALPVLEKLQIPAVMFVTTDALVRGRCYWWDVLARETARGGLAPEALSKLRKELKAGTHAQIEKHLEDAFGSDCFSPQGEGDRPLTPEELGRLSSHPLIAIGNHTHHHALLSQLPKGEAREELQTCQRLLQELTGKTPDMLAYPNGRWSPEVAATASELGLKHAFTTERALCGVPVPPSRRMSIPRMQPVDPCSATGQTPASSR